MNAKPQAPSVVAALVVLLIMAVALWCGANAAFAQTPAWTPEFKADVQATVIQQLVRRGMTPQVAGEVSQCMVDLAESEKTQAEMDCIVNGACPDDIGQRHAKTCIERYLNAP